MKTVFFVEWLNDIISISCVYYLIDKQSDYVKMSNHISFRPDSEKKLFMMYYSTKMLFVFKKKNAILDNFPLLTIESEKYGEIFSQGILKIKNQ